MAKSVSKLHNMKLIFLIFIQLVSFIQTQSLDKIKIIDVRVNGNVRIEDEDILRNARLWPEKEITIDDIQKSINYLWKLGRFSDVRFL